MVLVWECFSMDINSLREKEIENHMFPVTVLQDMYFIKRENGIVCG